MSSSKVSSDDETLPHGGVANTAFRQIAFGDNCGRIFTISPQVWRDPDISDEEAELFHEQTADKLPEPWVIHSSYFANLCTPKDGLRQGSLDLMQTEVDAADKLGIGYVNIHPGAHTGAGEQQGLDNVVSVLDDLDIPDGVIVLIEFDAGPDMKMGDDLVHLGYVLRESDQDPDACLNTAHALVAGYDFLAAEGVDEALAELDAEVGLKHLKRVHPDDPKHECRTNEDECALIGESLIGEEGMRASTNHGTIVDNDASLVLGTPVEDGKGFAWNIEWVYELRADRG